MDTSEFRDVFAAEARDYIQSLNENLLALETHPDNGDLLDDMFRAAHSLKGMSSTMGFTALAEFTHHMENVLDLLRSGQLPSINGVADTLFQCVDTLELLLEQTLADEPLLDTASLTAALDAMSRGELELDSAGTSASATVDSGSATSMNLDEFDRETVRQGIEQGHQALQVTVVLRSDTLLKSVRVYTVFQAVESAATIIKCYPSTQDLEEENFDNEFSLLLLTQEKTENIRQLIEGISEIEAVRVITLAEADLTSPEHQAGANPHEAGEDLRSSLSVERASEMAQTQAAEDTAAKDSQSPSGNGRPASTPKGRLTDTFVRVETERLDELINLVGELVINRTQVLEMGRQLDGEHETTTINQLDRITTELQYATMKLRMVPIKQVFDRFPRMVRDLAHSRDKDIRLELVGSDTELDRSIVNQIGEPLVHLLRNSVDHGLESREQRRQSGKNEQGTLRLEARHEGSHVLIELSDDGQGIDVDRIKAKAVERGLLPADRAEQLTVQEAVDLLFEPGFSTAESVSDISGRGVGMDAVKAVVESLSGSVDMESIPGQGTRTTIKLPLTLAIIKALLVATAGETYAIPIQAIRENLLIKREQIKTIQQREAIILRNEVLPLFDLAQCLGWERPTIDGDLPIIVVEVHGEKVGFVVEELIGQQEIVIKSLSGILGDITGIGGATVLGNGRAALILDTSTLVQ